jgi:hypothetical protein
MYNKYNSNWDWYTIPITVVLIILETIPITVVLILHVAIPITVAFIIYVAILNTKINNHRSYSTKADH